MAIVEENGGVQSIAALLKSQPGRFFEAADLKKALTHSIEALSYAHHAGVLHNKFTPENMLLDESGDVKIADFAIARVIADCVQRATRHVGASGELPYLSPQQLDGETATPQDDIYSLGATFFELLTGTPPFHTGDVIWKIRNEVVPSVADRRAERGMEGSNVPKGWDKLIASCLAKHIAERPKSVESIVPKRDLFEGAVFVMPVARPATPSAPATNMEPESEKVPAKPAVEPAVFVKAADEPLTETPGTPAPVRPGPMPLPTRNSRPEPSQLRLEDELNYREGPRRKSWLPLGLSAAALVVAGVVIHQFGLLDPVKNSLFGEDSSPTTASVSGTVAGQDVVQVSASEKDSLAQAREVLEAVRAERNSARTQVSVDSVDPAPVAEVATQDAQPTPPADVVADAQRVLEPLADVEGTAPEAPASESAPVEVVEAAAGVVEPEAADSAEPVLLASNTTSTPMPENLEDLSPEEAAAYEAIRAAEDARAKAEAALAAARKRREAEARLAEQRQAVEAAQRAAAEKTEAAEKATAALEKAQAERQAQVTQARSIMEEAQTAERLATEQEAKIASTQSQIDELRTKLEELTEQNSQLAAEIEEARTISRTKAESVEKVRSEMARLDEDVARAEQAADQAARAAEEARETAVKQARELEKAKDGFASGPADAPDMTPSSSNSTVPSAGAGESDAPDPMAEASAAWENVEESAGPTKVVATTLQSRPRALPGTSPPQGPVFTNSLQMNFVPVGEVLFSTVETRRGDFEKFVAATDHKTAHDWKSPGFDQTESHPVVNVTWDDAMEFCNWLTDAEREAGVINADQYYRLPTDLEWSRAVGLREERGSTPEARDMGVTGIYPWGTDWPPTGNAGNFTGIETGSTVAIPDYNDNHTHTAPVASFRPNAFGLYDMGGNVWEWCFDWMNRDQSARVLRGGSWQSGGLRLSLLSSVRICSEPDTAADHYGFRVVLVPGGSM